MNSDRRQPRSGRRRGGIWALLLGSLLGAALVSFAALAAARTSSAGTGGSQVQSLRDSVVHRSKRDLGGPYRAWAPPSGAARTAASINVNGKLPAINVQFQYNLVGGR